MISIDFLNEVSSSRMIDRATLLREYFQLLFLKYFYNKSRFAIFKGGTAIRFLFQSFRYSEDLDFTCVEKEDYRTIIESLVPLIKKETAVDIKLRVEKVIKEIGVRYRLVFGPSQMIKQPIGIKIDLSFREKPLDVQTSILSSLGYPISPLPLVRHYSRKEILAEKIRAMFARNKARDLFDLWFLLKQDTPIEWDFVIEKMKYYPEVDYSRSDLISLIGKYDSKKFTMDMNQFLPQNYRQVYPIVIREITEMLKGRM